MIIRDMMLYCPIPELPRCTALSSSRACLTNCHKQGLLRGRMQPRNGAKHRWIVRSGSGTSHELGMDGVSCCYGLDVSRVALVPPSGPWRTNMLQLGAAKVVRQSACALNGGSDLSGIQSGSTYRLTRP